MSSELVKIDKGVLGLVLDQTSNAQIVRKYGGLTMEKAVAGESLSLAKLRKVKGEEKTVTAVAVLVSDMSRYFGDAMHDEDAIIVGEEVLANYWHLNFEEIFFVLNRLKKSKIFGKLTMNVVLQAFEAYEEERCKHFMNKNDNAHANTKEASKGLDLEAYSEGLAQRTKRWEK